jgi:DNA-binding FadR family transcriptional regulator
MRDTCEAVSRLHGTIARAAAENRTDDDIERIRERLQTFRLAESGLQSQKADELLHIAISDAAHNTTLQSVLVELESRISISAPAHLWGEPGGMRQMEARALTDHEKLVAAICDAQADAASAIAREHARIDLELLEAALHRAGAPLDSM